MAEFPKDKEARMAGAAAMHLAAATGGFIAMALDAGETQAAAREVFLKVCTEMWDETVAELPGG